MYSEKKLFRGEKQESGGHLGGKTNAQKCFKAEPVAVCYAIIHI